jgi:hypothetical protein
MPELSGSPGPAAADLRARVRRDVREEIGLLELLRRHRDEKEKQRITAAQLRHDSGDVFTTLRGEPVNPNTGYQYW